MHLSALFVLGFMAMVSAVGNAVAGLPETIIKIKPSIVAIGTLQMTRRPPTKFYGTGFVVGDGNTVVTNAHVVPAVLAVEDKEELAVFIGGNNSHKARKAKQVAMDLQHDLVILRIDGPPLPTLELGDSNLVMAGESYAFTGFPLGTMLGFYPVTHRGMISSIAPIVLPAQSSRQLTTEMIRRLKSPFNIFQLDATAYPGNSGSPVYNLETGRVIAVLNMVFIKETKETVIEKPSGIAYAIPANYIKALLETIK
jgi:serine protease Do